MKKNNKLWFTIVEIIIASVFFTIIFVWLFSWIWLISSYVRDSNIKLYATSLAKEWVEKFDYYKLDKTSSSLNLNKWWNFIQNTKLWYYKFNTWSTTIYGLTESEALDYKNWEWPLDTEWYLKKDTSWVSYYRLLKFSDIETNSDINLKNTIFDCNQNNYICNRWVNINLLSSPFLSWSKLTWNNKIDLVFSTWTIFNKKSIFINYLWTGSMNISGNIWNIQAWYLDNIWSWAYIDFSSLTSIWDFTSKSITLSWITFSFWDNVIIWDSIDKTIYNLKNAINSTLEDYKSDIFYPNWCTIKDLFVLYNDNSDSKILFDDDTSNKCTDVTITTLNNTLTLSWNFSSISNYRINPTYKLKIDIWNTTNDFSLYSKLKSIKVTDYWVEINNGIWYSSIYNLWVRVIWVSDWKIITDEIFQTYITDL